MDEEKSYEGKSLRFFKEDFSLSDVVRPKILQKLKKEFDVDEAIPINLSIGLKNKDNIEEIVSLTHQKPEHESKRILLVDINDIDSFDKVKKVLEE